MSLFHPSCGHHGDYVMGIGDNMYCGVCKIEELQKSQRKVFKAGMIAILYEMHWELTGVKCTPRPWNKNDEKILTRLYNEWSKNEK